MCNLQLVQDVPLAAQTMGHFISWGIAAIPWAGSLFLLNYACWTGEGGAWGAQEWNQKFLQFIVCQITGKASVAAGSRQCRLCRQAFPSQKFPFHLRVPCWVTVGMDQNDASVSSTVSWRKSSELIPHYHSDPELPGLIRNEQTLRSPAEQESSLLCCLHPAGHQWEEDWLLLSFSIFASKCVKKGTQEGWAGSSSAQPQWSVRKALRMCAGGKNTNDRYILYIYIYDVALS